MEPRDSLVIQLRQHSGFQQPNQTQNTLGREGRKYREDLKGLMILKRTCWRAEVFTGDSKDSNKVTMKVVET
jgi:hypothetical protein